MFLRFLLANPNHSHWHPTSLFSLCCALLLFFLSSSLTFGIVLVKDSLPPREQTFPPVLPKNTPSLASTPPFSCAPFSPCLPRSVSSGLVEPPPPLHNTGRPRKNASRRPFSFFLCVFIRVMEFSPAGSAIDAPLHPLPRHSSSTKPSEADPRPLPLSRPPSP